MPSGPTNKYAKVIRNIWDAPDLLVMDETEVEE